MFIVAEKIANRRESNATNKALGYKHKLSDYVPIFAENFAEFCQAAIKAIEALKDGAEIFTIQTPIDPNDFEGGVKDSYTQYINKTTNDLLKRKEDGEFPKITDYRRLIVFRSTTESDDEKSKLKTFTESLFDNMLTNKYEWEPTLNNVTIGIIKEQFMDRSPFSNLDVFLIPNTYTTIAFPKEEGNKYHWGTSIHLGNNELLSTFTNKELQTIFDKVWDSNNVIHINYGTICQDKLKQFKECKEVNDREKVIKAMKDCVVIELNKKIDAYLASK